MSMACPVRSAHVSALFTFRTLAPLKIYKLKGDFTMKVMVLGQATQDSEASVMPSEQL